MDRAPGFLGTTLVATLGSVAVLIMFLGRGLTFWRDEWFFVQYRVGHTERTLLTPHGGHLLVRAVLIYKALFKLVGLETSHYSVYRGWRSRSSSRRPASMGDTEAASRAGGCPHPVAIALFLGPGWKI